MIERKKISRERYAVPENPYHVALRFGLGRIFFYLRSRHQAHLRTHVVVERRGNELELEFRRICDGGNFSGRSFQKKAPKSRRRQQKAEA